MAYVDGDGAHTTQERAKKKNKDPAKVAHGKHPNTIANLKLITPETARINQAKGVTVRKLNMAIQEEFMLNAKAFQKVMAVLPKLNSLDIMRMAIHTAIAKDNWEDAARYSTMLAEYEHAKLSRIESSVTTRTENLSDEELQAIIKKEGLSGSNLL